MSMNRDLDAEARTLCEMLGNKYDVSTCRLLCSECRDLDSAVSRALQDPSCLEWNRQPGAQTKPGRTESYPQGGFHPRGGGGRGARGGQRGGPRGGPRGGQRGGQRGRGRGGPRGGQHGEPRDTEAADRAWSTEAEPAPPVQPVHEEQPSVEETKEAPRDAGFSAQAEPRRAAPRPEPADEDPRNAGFSAQNDPRRAPRAAAPEASDESARNTGLQPEPRRAPRAEPAEESYHQPGFNDARRAPRAAASEPIDEASRPPGFGDARRAPRAGGFPGQGEQRAVPPPHESYQIPPGFQPVARQMASGPLLELPESLRGVQCNFARFGTFEMQYQSPQDQPFHGGQPPMGAQGFGGFHPAHI